MRKRYIHVMAMQRTLDAWEDVDSLEALSLPELETQIKHVENEYAAIQRATSKIMEEDMSDEQVDVCNTFMAEIESFFLRGVSNARARVQEIITANQPAAKIRRKKAAPREQTIREPEVGTFDGNMKAWPAFRDLFMAEVHERDMSHVHKLIYLQKACIGNAKQALGDWQPTMENYQLAWQSLSEKYDDPYRIKQALYHEIFRIPRMQEENATALRRIIDVTTNSLRQLETMGERVDAWNSLMMSCIVYRLPANVVDVWEQRRTINHEPTFKELINFLQGREYAENTRPPFDRSNKKHNSDRSRYTDVTNNNNGDSAGKSNHKSNGNPHGKENVNRGPKQGEPHHSGQTNSTFPIEHINRYAIIAQVHIVCMNAVNFWPCQ